MWDLVLLQVPPAGGNKTVIATISNDGTTAIAAGVVESTAYVWELTTKSADPFAIHLRVNGRALARNIVSPTSLTFRWEVGFFAGFADIELSGLEGGRRSFRVTIDPAKSKLTRDDFRKMTSDIFADTRSLATLGGLKVGLTSGSQALPIARLEYVLGNVHHLGELIRTLNVAHRRRLGADIQILPLSRVRGLSTSDWRRSRRSQKQISASSDLPTTLASLIERVGGRLPTHVSQVVPKPNRDLREHREILSLVFEMARHLTVAVSAQASLREGERDLILIDRCNRARRQLSLLGRATIFEGLQPKRGAWHSSRLYSEVEPYRELFKIHRGLRRGVAAIDGEFAHIPVQETFRLYETWVSLRLTAAAARLDPTLDGKVFFTDQIEANGLTFRLDSASVDFLGNRIMFKPVFKEVWKSDSGVGSISRPMIPDIVLRAAPVSILDSRALMVLDAKYRVETQLNDAIVSIHTYRDAIVSESPDGRLRGAVRGGLIIVPRSIHDLGTSDWKASRAPAVLFSADYQERFGLGAVELSPGMTLEEAGQLLVRILDLQRKTRYEPQNVLAAFK